MRVMSEQTDFWANWTRLEQDIPLDELPAFHREFLARVREEETNWDQATLRQVQGKVQASLKQLERSGDIQRENDDGDMWIKLLYIPSAYRHYIKEQRQF